MPKFIDISGLSFGKWKVLRYIGPKTWLCLCQECGITVRPVQGSRLRSGQSLSCGCKSWKLNADRVHSSNITHGMTKSREYRSLRGAIKRCSSPADPSYSHYGGRGITVCERWLGKNGFSNFYADMGPKPDRLTLERINVNGNYEPNNCKWATAGEQARNQRRNRILEYRGKSANLVDMALLYGINKDTLRGRLYRGWTIEEAIEIPSKINNRGKPRNWRKLYMEAVKVS